MEQKKFEEASTHKEKRKKKRKKERMKGKKIQRKKDMWNERNLKRRVLTRKK